MDTARSCYFDPDKMSATHMSANPLTDALQTDDELREWSWTFLRELARGQHSDLYSLEDHTRSQHEALAQIVCDALRHRSYKIRKAAAWVVGALDVVPENAMPLLAKVFQDRVALVRMAAAWAAGEMGQLAAPLVPKLVTALGDHDHGVRFAAVCSLGNLGKAAVSSVNALVEFLHLQELPYPEHFRAAVLKALGDIAPRHRSVQEAVVRELEAPGDLGKICAAYGAAQAESVLGDGMSHLQKNLDSADPYLVFLSAWAIGKVKPSAAGSAPSLLKAMQRFKWLPIEYSELPNPEFISVRSDFDETLAQALPDTDDEEYAKFRLLFFSHVFHPLPQRDTAWIYQIINHPWYLKLQRRRIGHSASAAGRQAIADLILEAQEKFANRLRKNPTLGVQPTTYALLPGFIKNHCRSIASSLRRQDERRRHRLAGRGNLFAETTSDDATAEAIEQRLREFIETELPDMEREVARLRWTLGWTISAVAATLGLTHSQVKTRAKNARTKLCAYLGIERR